MEIHALQTGTVRVKQFQLTGARHVLSRFYQLMFTNKWSEWMPIYCWLIKLDGHLLLIDTGETAKINTKGYLPDGGLYHKAVQTKINENDEITHQLRSLGYRPEDIDTIILTHLHGDHSGGITYFPQANFYVSQAEYDFATSKKGPGSGYFTKNWPDWFSPELITYGDGPEGNFSRSHQLQESKAITIVPTPGHSIGHQSVIVRHKDVRYFMGGDLTFDLQTLSQHVPNVVLTNKDAQNSVRMADEYVKTHFCIFLSSHDWNARRMVHEK